MAGIKYQTKSKTCFLLAIQKSTSSHNEWATSSTHERFDFVPHQSLSHFKKAWASSKSTFDLTEAVVRFDTEKLQNSTYLMRKTEEQHVRSNNWRKKKNIYWIGVVETWWRWCIVNDALRCRMKMEMLLSDCWMMSRVCRRNQNKRGRRTRLRNPLSTPKINVKTTFWC